MKIEIDTGTASKEELAHLASMLRNLAGSSGAVTPSSYPASAPTPDSGSIFSLFDDDPEPAAPAQPEPASGGLFSLFSDDAPSQPAEPASSGGFEPYGSVVVDDTEDVKPRKPTTAQDMLDDDRLIPY